MGQRERHAGALLAHNTPPRIGPRSHLEPRCGRAHSSPAEVRQCVEVLRRATRMSSQASVRAETGVKDVEFSFCPGEGWLAVSCGRDPAEIRPK